MGLEHASGPAEAPSMQAGEMSCPGLGEVIEFGAGHGCLRITPVSVRLHAEQAIPFDAGPQGRRGLHAIRLRLENCGTAPSAPVEEVAVCTDAGRWVKADPLFDLAALGGNEIVEGWLVVFLGEGEVPARLRCAVAREEAGEWLLNEPERDRP